ncbi:universal stress protein [Amycolatopsis sp. cg5]|uniref:universal stress protein n=1 Tax=Amycolatopsis sp. cg5 TaxID=3238802 RepID=UPI003524BAC9
MGTGPVILGFDGTPVSERMVAEVGELLGERDALVVTVWETGRVFDLGAGPAATLTGPVAPIDLRTAEQLDKAAHDSAQRTASRGVELALAAGLRAEGLAVADQVTVAETLVRLATEHKASVIGVGAHRHGRLSELLLGSTSKDVLRLAPCPVLVIRDES